jgi:hypothetical protein
MYRRAVAWDGDADWSIEVIARVEGTLYAASYYVASELSPL